MLGNRRVLMRTSRSMLGPVRSPDNWRNDGYRPGLVVPAGGPPDLPIAGGSPGESRAIHPPFPTDPVVGLDKSPIALDAPVRIRVPPPASRTADPCVTLLPVCAGSSTEDPRSHWVRPLGACALLELFFSLEERAGVLSKRLKTA